MYVLITTRHFTNIYFHKSNKNIYFGYINFRELSKNIHLPCIYFHEDGKNWWNFRRYLAVDIRLVLSKIIFEFEIPKFFLRHKTRIFFSCLLAKEGNMGCFWVIKFKSQVQGHNCHNYKCATGEEHEYLTEPQQLHSEHAILIRSGKKSNKRMKLIKHIPDVLA